MAFLNARVSGIRETKAGLRRVQRVAEKPDLYRASKVLADEARHIAPRRTGKLSRLQVLASGGVRAPARYSRYVHWGTRRRRKADAQPFILEAMERKTEEIVDTVAAHIDDEVRAVGGKKGLF